MWREEEEGPILNFDGTYLISFRASRGEEEVLTYQVNLMTAVVNKARDQIFVKSIIFSRKSIQ